MRRKKSNCDVTLPIVKSLRRFNAFFELSYYLCCAEIVVAGPEMYTIQFF